MAQKSSIKKLPTSLRKQLDRLILEDKLTIDQLRDFIAARDGVGKVPSRTSVGNYAKQVRDEARETAMALRESREMASAIAQELGPDSVESEQGRLLVEMLRTVFFRFVREKTNSQGEALNPDAFAKMARAMRDMSQTMQFEQDFARRIRDEERKKVEAEVQARVDELCGTEALKALSDEELKKRIAQLASG